MRKLHVIIILSIVAFINASYLTELALKVRDNTDAKWFCDISSTISCSNVFTTPQAWFGSIPFPAIALVVYPVLIAIAIWGLKKRRSAKAYDILTYLSAAGLLFNTYFIFTEAIVIKSFCLLCLLCTGIIITILILSLKWRQMNTEDAQ